MLDKELKRKIESLGVVTEDKMFIKYSNDGILDLVELIQEERKEAYKKGAFEMGLEANSDCIYESDKLAIINDFLAKEDKETMEDFMRNYIRNKTEKKENADRKRVEKRVKKLLEEK
jgi:hypothetical protein